MPDQGAAPRSCSLRERVAGPVVQVAGYTHARRTDDPAVRGKKSRETGTAMKQFNSKSSRGRFAMKLAANFGPGDIVGCLTYDDDRLPRAPSSAEERRISKEHIACWAKNMRRAWERRGFDPRGFVYAYSTEHKHGSARWHHHIVCTALGDDDFRMIRKAWTRGEIMQFTPLRVDEEKNFLTIAQYFTKEGVEKLGQRAWTFSLNAREPLETCELVTAEELADACEPPPGVIVLERHVTETPFGQFFYMQYQQKHLGQREPPARLPEAVPDAAE